MLTRMKGRLFMRGCKIKRIKQLIIKKIVFLKIYYKTICVFKNKILIFRENIPNVQRKTTTTFSYDYI